MPLHNIQLFILCNGHKYFYMKYILIKIFIFHTLFAFTQDKKLIPNLYTGIGYQDMIGPINYHEAIPYQGFQLGNAVMTSGVYIDLGYNLIFKSNHIGIGLRLGQTEQWNPETVKFKNSVALLPRAWYSKYFGKSDKKAFRLDFSILLNWIDNDVLYDPVNPSDIPNNQLYVCFGPQVGTRIIRKGAFANTYLIGGPVFAPPVKFDSFIVEDPSWNIRWMFGFSKSLSFKKS